MAKVVLKTTALMKVMLNRSETIVPYGHCIAVRITTENAKIGFKPGGTSGGGSNSNARNRLQLHVAGKGSFYYS